MKKLFRDVIREAITKMATAGIEDAETDAWLLAEYALGITKHKYYMDMQLAISEEEYEKYVKLLERRLNREPLQHITGSQQFMGLEFCVNEHVLIPRQDTELLVEMAMRAVEKCRQSKFGCVNREQSKGHIAKEDMFENADYTTTDKITILDMCTGSGCIAISLAKLCDNVQVTAADISLNALKVARENAKINQVDVSFVHTDLFENIEGSFDLIVSNPPYIPTKVINTLETEVKDHEPLLALDGNEDGLEFYEKISGEAFEYLNENGYLLFEIGHDQRERVSSILRKKSSCVKVYKDLANNDRVVIAGKEEL